LLADRRPRHRGRPRPERLHHLVASGVPHAEEPAPAAAAVVPPLLLGPSLVAAQVEIAGPRPVVGPRRRALRPLSPPAELVDVARAAVRAGEEERHAQSRPRRPGT